MQADPTRYGSFSATRIAPMLLASLLCVGGGRAQGAEAPSAAREFELKAAERGFASLGKLPSSAGGSGQSAAAGLAAYARVTKPGSAVEILTLASPGASAPSTFRVASYSVNCAERAIKYVSVRALDADWNTSSSPMPLRLPKTVWHRATAGSVEDSALRRACR